MQATKEIIHIFLESLASMIDCKPRTRKVTLLVFFFLTVSFVKIFGQDGRALFTSKCQTCHSPFKDLIGPALKGLQDRGPWSDKQKLYDWVHNPPGFMAKDAYTQSLKVRMGGSVMTGFPDLT